MQLEKDTFAVALSQICCQEEETSGWILEDRGQAVDNMVEQSWGWWSGLWCPGTPGTSRWSVRWGGCLWFLVYIGALERWREADGALGWRPKATCHAPHLIFLNSSKSLKLVFGGSVINRAYHHPVLIIFALRKKLHIISSSSFRYQMFWGCFGQ